MSKNVLGGRTLELMEDALTWSGEGLYSQIAWNKFRQIKEGKSAFYLYITKRSALIIPKRGFASEAEQTAFKAFAEERLAANKT